MCTHFYAVCIRVDGFVCDRVCARERIFSVIDALFHTHKQWHTHTECSVRWAAVVPFHCFLFCWLLPPPLLPWRLLWHITHIDMDWYEETLHCNSCTSTHLQNRTNSANQMPTKSKIDHMLLLWLHGFSFHLLLWLLHILLSLFTVHS